MFFISFWFIVCVLFVLTRRCVWFVFYVLVFGCLLLDVFCFVCVCLFFVSVFCLLFSFHRLWLKQSHEELALLSQTQSKKVFWHVRGGQEAGRGKLCSGPWSRVQSRQGERGEEREMLLKQVLDVLKTVQKNKPKKRKKKGKEKKKNFVLTLVSENVCCQADWQEGL